MKEFDKWLLTNEGQILVGDHRAKAAWRAALECVRDKMFPNCHELIDIYDFIEKELDT